MGRPPCCDKIGVKKGPWTPEEDIILVSYIQEHGPGNWRNVPTNTGLLRCSKSCRLRWTNYLRPGIKRGNFTEQEEQMIIHLQALLGNRWAAIASYLPQRTDNDIKNYWNTHLKKQLKKLQGLDDHDHSQDGHSYPESISKGQWERRLQTDIHTAKQALCEALSLDKPTNLPAEALSLDKPINLPELNPIPGYKHNPYAKQVQSSSTSYASSAENIARLLENWTKNSRKSSQTSSPEITTQSSNNQLVVNRLSLSEGTTLSATTPDEACLDSLLSFNSSNSDISQSLSVDETANFTPEIDLFQNDRKPNLGTQVPLTLLEKWLFDDAAAAQGQDGLMDMSLGESDGLF